MYDDIPSYRIKGYQVNSCTVREQELFWLLHMNAEMFYSVERLCDFTSHATAHKLGVQQPATGFEAVYASLFVDCAGDFMFTIGFAIFVAVEVWVVSLSW